VAEVSSRDPCPCGSGRRYKACHGRAAARAREHHVARPFAGRVDECEWIALREIVPAATAPLRLSPAVDRVVTLATVLPMAWSAMVRADGSIFVGLQVPTRSGDVSRDIAAALLTALELPPGSPVPAVGLPGPGPRLQELLDPAPLEVTVHDGFGFWVEGATPDAEAAAGLEKANATVVPTRRLNSVRAAYWCRIRERKHLRWVLPDEEEAVLDGLARLAVRGDLGLGAGSRYIGSFRAHGLVVPVWDLAPDSEPEDVEEPATAFRSRLSEELAEPRLLTGEERRARAGLVSRQLTLR